MNRTALLIGNSDGIGLAATGMLLDAGWDVAGISRSDSTLAHESYRHTVAEVQRETYREHLGNTLEQTGPPDVCIYCAGVGELLDPSRMDGEVDIFEVNLVGMVKTAACVVPLMVERGSGHFIGLSSVADSLLSPQAPSYHASKAAFTRYLESLTLALRPHGVHVSNVRFGFVDTKMAKGDVKPFMMTADRAARHLIDCIDRKPARLTAPRIVVPLVAFRNMMLRLSYRFGGGVSRPAP